MTNKEFYQDTFSQIHSSADIRWEDMSAKRRIHRPVKRLVVLAAAVCLLAGTAAAVSQGWFGLRSLEFQERKDAPAALASMEGGERIPTGMISLQGCAGSPEYQAAAEWHTFLNGYDTHTAALEADAHPGQVAEKYELYGVYDQVMADKLDEITEKYGLALHREINIVDHDELACRIGGEFLGESHGRYWGYIYDDGTFQMDGDAWVEGYGQIDYQLRRTVKGVFDEVYLNIIGVGEYSQWQYETASGEDVLLALGPGKALILGDFPECFVAVNVLAGTETDPDDIFSSGPISAADLENLADGIGFQVLKIVQSPNMRGDSQVEETMDPAAFYAAAGVEEAEAQAFYCEFVRAIEEGRKEDVAAMIAWPRTVFTQEGSVLVENWEDFLPYYDDVFTEDLLEAIHENQYDHERADLICHDGMIGGAGGDIWFALLEDDRMAVLTVQNPEGNSIRYDGPAGITAE